MAPRVIVNENEPRGGAVGIMSEADRETTCAMLNTIRANNSVRLSCPRCVASVYRSLFSTYYSREWEQVARVMCCENNTPKPTFAQLIEADNILEEWRRRHSPKPLPLVFQARFHVHVQV